MWLTLEQWNRSENEMYHLQREALRTTMQGTWFVSIGEVIREPLIRWSFYQPWDSEFPMNRGPK